MKTLLTFLFAISVFGLAAQDVSYDGYIVLPSGDTVKGTVKDFEWLKNPTSVEFKKTSDSDYKRYTAKEITAFSSARPVLYEVKNFKYDGDLLNQKTPTNGGSPADYPKGRQPSKWVDSTSFLEVIVKSEISLYRFVDDDSRSHFFLEKKGATIQELLHRRYVTEFKNTTVIMLSEDYKQQLINVSGVGSALTKRIMNTPFDYNRLKNLIEYINTSKGNEILSLKGVKIAKKRPQFGLVIQLQQSNGNAFTNNISLPLDGVNYSLGVSYEIFSKRLPNRMSIFNEVKFESISQKGEGGFNAKKPLTFNFRAIKGATSVRIAFGNSSKLFCDVGILLGIRIKTVLYDDKSAYNNTQYEKYGEQNSFEDGFIVGIGRRFPKINTSLSLRYEYESKFFMQRDYRIDVQNFGIVGAYHF